ncbi:hypothetical protein [Lacticaseibacillus daqingensis]|uniref:hypothetical protein n=1 Tax=Lacticaseibacillus daqingensis TaxID=2486014 RepID=UPI000F765EFE|nr:hypothetical protein [Lacticaseibacillus daqingensis]
MDKRDLWILGVAGLWGLLVGVQVLRGHWLRLVRGNFFGGQTEALKQGGARFAGWFYIGLGILAEGLVLGAVFLGWR